MLDEATDPFAELTDTDPQPLDEASIIRGINIMKEMVDDKDLVEIQNRVVQDAIKKKALIS